MIDTKEYIGKSELNFIDANKLILLVGAGVSIEPPAGLPSGRELTEYYLKSCIGNELTNEIMQTWEKLNKVINSANGFEISLIRLEFIVGCINDIDIEFNYLPLIAGFQQFANAKPNINHFNLGEIKRKGCEIITPNFDCGIEKVFGNFRTTTRLEVPANEVENSGVIYHYHGIGTQYEQLGATIGEIKKGVKQKFGKQLREWFQQGYSIIAVGFSCSDYFDMTPFFETLPKNTYEGKAIFFQHGDTVDIEVQNKIEKFYSAFKEKEILYGNTKIFLADLCNYVDGKNCGYDMPDTKAVDWKMEFERILKIGKREKLFYLIKLLNQIGINLSENIFEQSPKPELIKKFSCMSELLEYVMEILKKVDVKSYIVELEDRSKSIFSDIIDICRIINYSSENSRRIKSDFWFITQGSGVRKEAKQIQYDELTEHIKMSTLAPENFVTVYVYAFNRIAKEQIKYILNQNTATTSDIKIKTLYDCAAKMLKLDFYKYEYISYYISIMKIYNILCIMLEIENDIESQENHMLNIALEICGLSLVAKIYFNTVLQYIMLFAIKKDLNYVQRAKKKMLTARECIEITGNCETMLLWKDQDKKIQKIENEYSRSNSVDYCEIAKLIV